MPTPRTAIHDSIEAVGPLGGCETVRPGTNRTRAGARAGMGPDGFEPSINRL